MRVVLIGHRYVDLPRGGGYAWGLAQHVELAVVKVGVGAMAHPISGLEHVPVHAIDLGADSTSDFTVTPKASRPGWYTVRQRWANGTYQRWLTQDPTPPRPVAASAREELARRIGGDRGILLKGAQLDPDDVRWLGERVDLTYVLVDVVLPGYVARGRHCARTIVTGPEAVPAFEATGRPVRRIIQGWRPHVWAPPTPLPHDFQRGIAAPRVVFTGSERQDRLEAFAALTAAGLEVVRREAWLQDASELYRTSAVTLCPHNSPSGRDSYSNRLVRVMAAGGTPLHAYTPSVAADFPGVPTYRTPDEMVRKARELVRRSPSDRLFHTELMRDAAMPYTWDKVARRWLDFICANGGGGV